MRIFRSLVLLVVVLAPAAASALTLDEIVYMSKAGVSESIILALIDRDKTVFTMTPEQVVALQTDGVSEAVILAMLKSGRAEGDAAARADEDFNRELFLSDRAALQAEAREAKQAEAAARPPEVVTVPVPVPVAVPYAFQNYRHRAPRAPHRTFAPAVPPPPPIVPGVAPMSSAVSPFSSAAPSLCIAHVATGPAPPLLNSPGFLTACPPGVR